MKAFVLLFAGAFYFVVSTGNERFICPFEWELFNRSCYKSVLEKMNFNSAVISCTAMSGRLAVPTSVTEHQFIWDMVSGDSSGGVWVGCTNLEGNGKWVQPGEGGEECSFVNWYPGEPNDYEGEDCAKMKTSYNGRMNNDYCESLANVVCQRPVTLTTASPVGLYYLQAHTDGRLASKCLTSYVIKDLPIKGVVACGSACRDEPRCRSFNVRFSSGGEKICHLNNATRQDADKEDIEMDNSCYYFKN